MLHYEIWGNLQKDKYMVMIHGFGGNHRVWKNQIDLLSEEYNVVTIDLPSHYEGNIKLSDMNISLESVSREIVAVLDYLGIEKASFMGLSLGTVFIKHIQHYFPQYVEKAYLAGAIGNVGLFLKAAVAVFSRIGDKLPFYVVYKIFSKILMPWKVSKKSREIFCECAKILNPKEFKAYMFIFREHFKFNKRFVTREHKDNLYISGVGDLCFLKGILAEVKKTKAKLIVLKNCGHVCNIDSKDEYNKLITEYCFV